MLITISVPKLASIRDNHSLRRGAATESLRSVEEELRKTKYKKERKTSLNSSELKSSFSPKHNPKEADPPHPALSIVHGGKVHA